MEDARAVVAAALLAPMHQRAIADGETGAIVRAARRAMGLTQAALADLVACSQATVSRIERGSTRAVQDVALLADLGRALHLPPSVLGLATASDDTTLGHVRRRDFMASSAALAAAALLPQAIVSRSAIGQPDIDHAWRALERMFELDDYRGGIEVYEVAASIATKFGEALRFGRFSPPIEQQLQTITATTMEHAGWLAFDAGKNDRARAWWLETVHLARDVGSVPEAHTAALASMSLQASGDRRRAREAFSLARAAHRAASGERSKTLLSLLAAREAVGHAQVGDRVAVRNALNDAHRSLDAPSPSDPLWLQFWSPADLACHETRVALALGDSALAERTARTALEAADETRFPRNHAIYSARLGAVLTRRRKLDEAIAVTTNAVKRIDQIGGSRRIVAELTQTLDDLSAQPYPPARQFSGAARRMMPSLK